MPTFLQVKMIPAYALLIYIRSNIVGDKVFMDLYTRKKCSLFAVIYRVITFIFVRFYRGISSITWQFPLNGQTNFYFFSFEILGRSRLLRNVESFCSRSLSNRKVSTCTVNWRFEMNDCTTGNYGAAIGRLNARNPSRV